MIATLTLAAICAVAAFVLTAAFRSFALRKGILDVPVARSSHTQPVPRGGGSAVAITAIVSASIFTFLGLVPAHVGWGLVFASAAVSLVGLIDDLYGATPLARLGVHILAAAWLVYWIGIPDQVFGLTVGTSAIWSILVGLIVVLYLVWNINLYNFMDGIDGLAATQMIFVSAAASVVLGSFACGPTDCDYIDFLTMPLAGASFGFLVWNFPKARVFLGDVGSGFLGAMVGGVSLASVHQAPSLIWCWFILMGLFFVDATYTLIRRMLAGKSPLAAHRTHAYQILVRRIGTHWQVTTAMVVVNVCWLLPWAYSVAIGWVGGSSGLAISYLPLIAIVAMLGAGNDEAVGVRLGD